MDVTSTYPYHKMETYEQSNNFNNNNNNSDNNNTNSDSNSNSNNNSNNNNNNNNIIRSLSSSSLTSPFKKNKEKDSNVTPMITTELQQHSNGSYQEKNNNNNNNKHHHQDSKQKHGDFMSVSFPIISKSLKSRHAIRYLPLAWGETRSFRKIVRDLKAESTWKTNARAFVAIYACVILWIGAWNILTNCYGYFPTVLDIFFTRYSIKNFAYTVVGTVIVLYTGTLYQNAGFQGSNRPPEFFSYEYAKYRQLQRDKTRGLIETQDKPKSDNIDNNDSIHSSNTSLQTDHRETEDFDIPADGEILKKDITNGLTERSTHSKKSYDTDSYNHQNIDTVKKPSRKRTISCWRLYHVRFWLLTGIGLLGEFILFIGLYNIGDILYLETLSVMPFGLKTFLWILVTIVILINPYINTIWVAACVLPPWYEARRCNYNEPLLEHVEIGLLSLLSLFGMNMAAVVTQDNLQDYTGTNIYKPLFSCSSGLLLYVWTGSFIGNSFIWLSEKERQKRVAKELKVTEALVPNAKKHSWLLKTVFYLRALVAFFAQVEHQVGAWELFDIYIVAPTLSRDIVYVVIGLLGLQWSKALLMNACITPFNVPVRGALARGEDVEEEEQQRQQHNSESTTRQTQRDEQGSGPPQV